MIISSKKWTYRQMMAKKLVCGISKYHHVHNGYCFEVEDLDEDEYRRTKSELDFFKSIDNILGSKENI